MPPGTARVLWDTHAHILHDLDDGPATLEDAIDIARGSAERGVTGIVATPHSLSVLDSGGPSVIDGRVEELNRELSERGVSLQVAPGMEIRLQPDTATRLTDGDCIGVNRTRNALIEFDYTQWAQYSDSALFDIEFAGFRPILAHVERIVPLQRHPGRVNDYVQRGYFAQITAMSLFGSFGNPAKRIAESLLATGLVHVVASDTHAGSGHRGPWPVETLARLERLVGEEAAELLVYVNPQRLVEGECPLPITPRPAKRRFWLFR